jgi:DNA-binding NtrC family response regulator
MLGEREHQLERSAPLPELLKVLVVSENADELARWRRLLPRSRYQLRTCRSYSEGAQRAADDPFDLVLVDQGTPAFEGRPVVECAAHSSPSTPILVLARVPEMSCYTEAMELGATDYIEKSVPADRLLRMVETYTHSRASAA